MTASSLQMISHPCESCLQSWTQNAQNTFNFSKHVELPTQLCTMYYWVYGALHSFCYNCTVLYAISTSTSARVQNNGGLCFAQKKQKRLGVVR